MKSWKIAFFVCLTIMILTIIGAGYIVLTNTILSGHNYDNLLTLAEDIEQISKAIQNKANTINEFDRELQKCDAGHLTDTENNIISLQIAAVLFDSNGKFTKIETYYLNNKEGDN